jgi:hypothetical protein
LPRADAADSVIHLQQRRAAAAAAVVVVGHELLLLLHRCEPYLHADGVGALLETMLFDKQY